MAGGFLKTSRFRPLTIQDEPWITACRDVNEHPFTALSFPSLYTWQKEYGLTVTGDEDFYLIRSRHDQAYYCPCGNTEKCSAVIAELTRREAHPHLLYLTKSQAEALEKDGWYTRQREDLSEYISSSSALALCSGHMSNSFKVKCRRIKKELPYRTRELSEADLPMLRAIAHMLESNVRAEEMGDLSVLNSELDVFSALRMKGLFLEADNGGSAFIIGYENIPGMFTMTMSKHTPQLPSSITAVCVHELACFLKDEYPLIDLEEDLGLEGLRRAKELYSPVDMLDVYEAIKI